VTYRPFEYAKQWRHRAEELRTIGESYIGDAAREIYFKLAEDYDRLAERSEAMAAAVAGRTSPISEKPPTSLYRWGRTLPRDET